MSGASQPSASDAADAPNPSAANPAPGIDDDPCWGGPEPRRHDLECLLRVLGSPGDRSPASGNIDNPSTPSLALSSPEDHAALIKRVKQNLILYEDDNYVAINKPADLRMDGPHRATVHKLLLYLNPPPSLRQMASEEVKDESAGDRDNEEASDSLQMHNRLLKAIAPLANRSCLKDDPHRMVHQLDYATSGVLLLGKTKKATGAAAQAFEHRKTNKQYVAVVIHPPSDSNLDDKSDEPPFGKDFLAKLPALPVNSLDAWRDGSLEKRYRKKRERECDDREGKKGTFDGYMPVQSVFDKWRATLMRERKKQKGGQSRRRANDNLPPLPSPQRELSSEEIEELLSLGPSYKKVKSHCAKSDRNWTHIFEEMAKEYNRSLADHYATKIVSGEAEGSGGADHASNFPPLFRIEGGGNGDDGDVKTKDGVGAFYICASIGEPKDGRFHVIVDPAVSKQTQPSSPLPELRPSLTKCTILWRGYINATGEKIPVTKVLLQPWTGRRHQLRIHLAHVAGCPILGDVAYGGNLRTSGESSERDAACARMCLHAKELSMPLLGVSTKTFVAPDPFVTAKKDGEREELLFVS